MYCLMGPSLAETHAGCEVWHAYEIKLDVDLAALDLRSSGNILENIRVE